MSDASRSRLLISPETIFGETPASPAMQNLRFTGESLKHGNDTEISEEIRDDRTRDDQMLVGYNAGGTTNHEFSASTFDMLIEAALGGTWAGGILQNGVTKRSFLLERGLLDIGQFFYYPGMEIEAFNLAIDPKRKVTCSFDWMGTRAFRATTSRSGSIIAKTTTPVITSGPFITGLAANVNMTGLRFRSLRLQVKNNLRPSDDVSSYTSAEHGRGPQDVTGSLEVYFQTAALYDQFLANGAIDFSFTIGDGTRSYAIRLPKFKLPDATDPQASAVDADVVLPIEFRGFFEPVTGCHLRITRTPAS